MAPKRYSKRSLKIRGKPKKKVRAGTTRSFSALAPPRYEKKFLDTQVSAAMNQYNTAGVCQSNFVLMDNGTGNGARIGDRITVTNINCHLTLSAAGATAALGSNSTVARVILGIDKQANGAVTAVTDVLQSADPFAFRNMFTLNRFVILKDKLVTINMQAVTGSYWSEVGRVLKFAWKGQLPIMYSGTGATIAQVKSNNIFLLVVCDRTGSAPDVTYIDGLDGVIRIKYTDA